jgi:hypothetical protein
VSPRSDFEGGKRINTTAKAKIELFRLVKLFQKGQVSEALASTVLIPKNMPSSRWTMNNRLLALLQTNEIDCRGYQQWKLVNRQVKGGAQAAYILRPRTLEEKDEETGEDKIVVVGFACLPVFSYSSTDGEPLPELIPPEPPALLNVAERFGLKVEYQACCGLYRGAYDIKKKEIVLCTHQERTFFHELAHAAHNRVLDGKLKMGQDAKQEIAAELSSNVLARLYGKQPQDEGHAYRYIENYAKEMKKDVATAIVSVLTDVEKVLELIISTAEGTPESVGTSAESVEIVAGGS